MKTVCPNCRTEFRVPETAIGKKSKCPKCSTRFTIAKPADTTEDQVSVLEAVFDSEWEQEEPVSDIVLPGPKRLMAQPSKQDESTIKIRTDGQDYVPTRDYSGIKVLIGLQWWLTVLFILGAIVGVVAVAEPDYRLGGLIAVVFCVVAAFANWVSGQFTQLFLDVEENTRLTRAACMRIADLLAEQDSNR